MGMRDQGEPAWSAVRLVQCAFERTGGALQCKTLGLGVHKKSGEGESDHQAIDDPAVYQVLLDDFVQVLVVHIGVPRALRVNHQYRPFFATVEATGLIDADLARAGQSQFLHARLQVFLRGTLTVFALYPRIRHGWAIVLALMLGVLLSGIMEATQTVLPNRVASNLDLLTNTAGALLGAIVGSRINPLVMERSRLRHLRQRWFVPEASRGLIVFALWPLAQIYPQSYLFGNGQALPVLSDWLSLLFSVPLDLGSWLRNGAALTVRQYWGMEAVVTACGMSGALLALLCMLRPITLLIIGLGETDEEVLQVMRDMRAHNVDMLTIGQYLMPSGDHLPVRRYVHPDTFSLYEQEAYKMGFAHAAVGAMVRSSYHADQQAHGVTADVNNQ
jgi:hypothetical protein